MIGGQRVVPQLAFAVVAVVVGLGFVHAEGSSEGLMAQAAVGSTSSASPSAGSPGETGRAMLDRYCVTCHNSRLRTAELDLETLDLQHVPADAEVWEKVIKKLRMGSMPPLGRPRPDEATSDTFASWLVTTIDDAAAAQPYAGRPAIHRLNRTEYTNAIRDLFGLEVDGELLLPADDSGYGFDNIADVLTVSPLLVERYILAAKEIARLVVGDATLRPTTSTYSLPYLTLVQDRRMSDALPFGSRGGTAIRHHFPVDGEYEIRVYLQRNSLNIGAELRGLDVVNEIDVRIDRERVALFSIGGRVYKPGQYSAGDDQEDARLRVRLPVKAGLRTVGITFPQNTWYMEGVGVSRLPAASDGYSQGRQSGARFGKIEAEIAAVDISGPFGASTPDDLSSRRRVFVCQPAGAEDEEPCARTILSTVARRAYRHPVMDADIDMLFGFYEAGRDEGGFDVGIQWALERILTDPAFLFRVEQTPPTTPASGVHRISDIELASRLSFFLWSSIPDDELLDVAEQGRLADPAELEAQVRRMRQDLKSKAFIDNFFGQWLLVRNVEKIRPDPKSFPLFDENLRQAFQRETELFLESQVRDDRPVTDLLTADYTFVNERLAQHYDLPNIYGNHFRRVELPNDRRAGLLGQGSVLSVTSYPDRTSVVVRGKWILENLLGAPPPPPPPSVPPLENTKVEGTLRQRMELHRKNPTCAGCHRSLDPLGFALENFDGIGRWRNTDGGASIDASGALSNGVEFDSPASFRQALLSQRTQFLSSLTQKLLTYAVGRGVEHKDMPAVRAILRESAPSDYRWSSLVLNIVKSVPFQMRSAS